MKYTDINDLEFITLAERLFSVKSSDIDDNGAKCEEVILVQFLAEYPEMLKHKPLSYWFNTYIGKVF